jgi:hypothetical protein
MADLAPHPLVLTIGKEMAKHGDQDLRDAVDKLENALPADGEPLATGGTGSAVGVAAARGPLYDDGVAPQVKNAVAKALGEQVALQDLVLFAGYLGPRLRYKGVGWRLLYLDERLQRWLLAPEEGIVDEERLYDQHAAFECRDAMWVKGDARVIQGMGPRSMEGRFLVGDITGAADVAPAPAGGMQAAATGLFCEAATPNCCYGARSRR